MIATANLTFRRYRHTMHPNTLNPEDYYWYAWTKEERAALELLKGKNAIGYSNKITIEVPLIAEKRDYLPKKTVLRLAFGRSYDSWPYPEVTIKDEDITDPTLRSKLLAWTVRDYQLAHWQRRMDHYALMVVKGYGRQLLPNNEYLILPGVNTPGQLYRAWPEFASMVEKKYTDRMAGQKLKSSMPVGWTDEKLQQFRTLPYMDEINSVLLACSVMDDMEIDRLYPTH